jgi:hypothetical protein
MHAVVIWHGISSAWGSAKRQAHRLSRTLEAIVWLALAATATLNNVLPWTGALERLFADHGGYSPEWPLLPVATGVLFVAPLFTLFMVAVLLDSRRRLWPILLLTTSHFVPLLILPVLALLAWDVRRRR